MKLLITVLGAIILLVHKQPIGILAGVARERTLSGADLRELRIQLVANAGAALLVLLVITTLAVYKPQGLTPYMGSAARADDASARACRRVSLRRVGANARRR